MRSPVALVLKQRTSDIQHRIEKMLDLTGPDLTVERVRRVLERFAGFCQGTERLVDEWAATEPALAEALSWPRRRRSETIRADLLRLGLTLREIAGLAEAPPVFAVVDCAAVFGWLYASECAALGGAAVERALQAAPAGLRLHLRTFVPYLEGPGPMWRTYVSSLRDWVGDDVTRRDDVVAAAERTFVAAEEWLGPLGDEEGLRPAVL